MKKRSCKNILVAAIGLAMAGAASAHVGYGSALYSGSGAYDPLTNGTGTGTYGAGSNFNATVASNAGYLTGLDPVTLGNTHDIRFRYFTLAQSSQVSFTIVGTTNANGSSTLNPGFSLYSGVLPSSSHEGVGDVTAVAADADVAAYLATAPKFASWSPFAGVNALRGGPDTGLWGVFDTNGNITTGNNGTTGASDTRGANYLGGLDTAKIATITYLGISKADAAAGSTFVDSLGNTQSVLGADGVVDNTVSWSGTLGPGIYTLAIGGANLANYSALFNDVRDSNGGTGSDAAANARYTADRLARGLSIQNFTVTAVPEPESWAMMLAGLLLTAGIASRRRSA